MMIEPTNELWDATYRALYESGIADPEQPEPSERAVSTLLRGIFGAIGLEFRHDVEWLYLRRAQHRNRALKTGRLHVTLPIYLITWIETQASAHGYTRSEMLFRMVRMLRTQTMGKL